MPVGTQGTVKGLLPQQVAAAGARIVLANTYHLMLRPGSELVAAMGGLHRWSQWSGSILTDSGGFQVFSLADDNRITEEGVTFKSHLDGRSVLLTPEGSMRVQNELGADIIMAFDDCPPAQSASEPLPGAPTPAANGEAPGAEEQDPLPEDDAPSPRRRHTVPPAQYRQRVQSACDRSIRWLERCVKAHARKADQALLGIVQGGTDLDLRTRSAELTCALDLPGYAIGGVAVGEGYDGLKLAVEHTAPLLPADRPRYLMGVGYERDILTAVRAGVDLFDCVLPTRNARNGYAFTPTGALRLRNAAHARDPRTLDESCDCPACDRASPTGGFSRSYLRHLFLADEMLGPILVTLHNVRHFQRFLLDIRRAIQDNDWSLVFRRWPAAGRPSAGIAAHGPRTAAV
jgi:queuine tRNA-ribosyltransferase